ncbi:MAG: fibronectin type III domain-containing protein [Muribaculaceae bacterium]|nr:fibronectin type III domain-containing protein [Muribaculaceae bacterium]
MKRFLFLLIAVVVSIAKVYSDDLQINSIQYWVDNNYTTATVSSDLEFDISCESLSPGFHILHYRIADNRGKYSALKEYGFLKVEHQSLATSVDSLQYWWDDLHQNAATAPYQSEEFTLSTTALPTGLHNLKYRVKDNTGRWSGCHTHYFYKGEQTDSARIVSYSYWWNDLSDNKVTQQIETPTSSISIDQDFSVPEEARTNFAGHYTATLNIVIKDNHGRAIYLSSNVEYPDNEAPKTDIDADRYVASSSVNIKWTESTEDKMGDYNVYVSKDNGPFLLWLPDTKQTSAIFKGVAGSVYLFTVTGRDAYGNREEYDETKCVSVTFE